MTFKMSSFQQLKNSHGTISR